MRRAWVVMWSTGKPLGFGRSGSGISSLSLSLVLGQDERGTVSAGTMLWRTMFGSPHPVCRGVEIIVRVSGSEYHSAYS
jgi:hypothetical protein